MSTSLFIHQFFCFLSVLSQLMDTFKCSLPMSLLLPDLFVFWLMFQMVCERSEVFASACALARAFPLFTHRSSASRRTEKKTVTVEFFLVGQNNGPIEVETLKVSFYVVGFSPHYQFFFHYSLKFLFSFD